MTNALWIAITVVAAGCFQHYMIPTSWEVEKERVLQEYGAQLVRSPLFQGHTEATTDDFATALHTFFEERLSKTPRAEHVAANWKGSLPSAVKSLANYVDADGNGNVSVNEAIHALLMEGVPMWGTHPEFKPPLSQKHWVYLRQSVFGIPFDGTWIFDAFTLIWRAFVATMVVHLFVTVWAALPHRSIRNPHVFARTSEFAGSQFAKRGTAAQDASANTLQLVTGVLGSFVLPFFLVAFSIVMAVMTAQSTFGRLRLDEVGPFSLCVLLWMQSVRGSQEAWEKFGRS